MNTLVSQLLALSKKIISQLQEIARQLQLKNENDAKDRKAKADHGNKVPSPNILPTRVEINSLPPPSDKEIAYREEKHSRERKKFSVEKWTLFVLAIYTAVAGIQAYLTKRALNSSNDSFKKTLTEMQAQTAKMGNSVDAANRNAAAAERAERAWVGPGKPYFNIDHSVSKILPNIPIHANFTLENFGKMPATIDEIGVMLEVRDTPVPENAKYRVEPGKAVLFPTGTAITNDSVVTISPTDFESIKKKTRRLVLHGIIRYHDTFGNHTTKLCLRWGTQEARDFEPCLEHNWAD